MKRQPMPPRRVALAAGPVRLRRTPLARNPMRRPQRPTTGTTAPAGGKDWSAEVRALLAARSGGNCEVRLIGCTGQATDAHHRKRRAEGDHRALNGLAACRTCHGEVHRSPAISKAAGWIVPPWDDPATVPVRIAGRGLVWLTEAGKYVGEGAR